MTENCTLGLVPGDSTQMLKTERGVLFAQDPPYLVEKENGKFLCCARLRVTSTSGKAAACMIRPIGGPLQLYADAILVLPHTMQVKNNDGKLLLAEERKGAGWGPR